MVADKMRMALQQCDMDIGRTAAMVQTPRSTFVRIIDRLGVPRASTLDEDDIRQMLRACHGDISIAAERLQVSSVALSRRLNKDD